LFLLPACLAVLLVPLLLPATVQARPTFGQAIDRLFARGYPQAVDHHLYRLPGTNPALGFRWAGTAPDNASARYLARQMRAIGLKNVHLERVPVDVFDFKRASVKVGSRLMVASTFSGIRPTPLKGLSARVVYVHDGTAQNFDALGDLLRRAVEVPARDRAFDGRLRSRLERADGEHGGRVPRRRLGFAGRPGAIAFGAAAAAAAAALVLTLTGVPGVRSSSPQPATAAERLVANINAGLAKVQTVQGVFVVDDLAPVGPLNSNPQLERARFAATAAGDRYFDIRYRCNRAAAVHAWRKELKALGPNWHGGQALSASAAEGSGTALLQLRSIVPRTIWVCDATAADLRPQVKREYVDALTGRVLGWSYRDYRGLMFFVLGTENSAAAAWSPGTQLRIELAEHDPEVTVAESRYQGRSVQKATISNSAGKPVHVAYIDDRYGITLALRQVSGATPDRWLTPFHVEDLKVNHPIPASRFTMTPDYSLDPRYPPGHAQPNAARNLYVSDFGGRTYPAAELGRLALPATLVPSWVPAGYHFDSVFGAPGEELALVYRQGLLEFSVDSYGRDELQHLAPAFHRSNWPPFFSYERVFELGRGPLAGWPAAIDVGSSRIAAVLSSTTFSVQGDLAPRDLRRVAGSLHSATGAYPAPSEYATPAAIVLVAGIAIAAGVVLLWFLRLRRRGPGRPSIQGVGWLPPIGAAVVVLGAGLDWHAMLGYGHGGTFAVAGWHEPLGLATVGMALAAAAVAACVPLAGLRLPVGPRLVAAPLACLALAGAVLGVFYVPVQARFVIQSAPQLDDFLDKYFANPASRSAGPGLYVSILGCLVLFVGVFLIGRRSQDARGGERLIGK
jgi:hypothetical protein